MIIISHRGNVRRINSDRENSPSYLLEAISLGFDVEVDVWIVGADLYLGHNCPEHRVGFDFISTIFEKAWFHCKNIEALQAFAGDKDKEKNGFKFFWHQEDDYTLTSNGYIWCYPEKSVNFYTPKTPAIAVIRDNKEIDILNFSGVCTDEPLLFRTKLENI